MKNWLPCFSVVVLLFAGRTHAEDPPAKFDPTTAYEIRTIEGWKVYVHKSLLNVEEHKKLGADALRLLEVKLYGITRVIPAAPLREIKKVPIWLEHRNPRHRGAQYHPSRKWLTENNYNPEKAKAVELSNAIEFVEWTRNSQPNMLLHELAHAYHDRVLSYDNQEIKAAYESAKKNSKYKGILHNNGKQRDAYALSTPMEYFAEATEAFFGRNDFYPFVRAELREYDPTLYAIVKKVWKVRSR